MHLFYDFIDQSKQMNQAPQPHKRLLPYHPPNKHYKIVHQALMIPNLPAPLHYLNFVTLLGQPNAPALRNEHAIQTHALDTATVIASSSPHMVGHFQHYSIDADCQFNATEFQFLDREKISGSFPLFRVQREDAELSFDLQIKTTPIISYFNKLRLGLAEHWSVLSECRGTVQYKGQNFNIHQLGSFEFARSIQFPYLPLAFLTYQIINLSDQRQILLMQTRDAYNSILQSRIYLRDLKTAQAEMFDQGVYFKVHRVYPLVKTPNGQGMYLPREFEWHVVTRDGTRIQIQAQSRGDFKFGLAAGYVGSFHYQIKINEYQENGESGYCEYIDCRALKWQEQNKTEKLRNNLANSVPFFVKK